MCYYVLLCYTLVRGVFVCINCGATPGTFPRILHDTAKNSSKLENVAIANALQLEAARCRAVPLRFNFVARAKFEVAQSIRCRLRAFLLLIRYVTL